MSLQPITEVGRLKGKRVLVRVDFNVPVVGGKVRASDDWRIRAALKTIQYLKDKGACTILLTHVGRPGGKEVPALRVDPIARRLGELLKIKIIKFNECVGPLVTKAVSRLKAGQVAILENVRFYPGEEANDEHFARDLAALGELYVNEAFSAAHRTAASLVAITNFLPSAAGMNTLQEIAALDRVLKRPKKPLVVIIGGIKAETKIAAIRALLPKADHILLGGGIANTFWAAVGRKVGNSLVDTAQFREARRLVAHKKIVLPVDVVVQSGPDHRRGHLVAIDNNRSRAAALHSPFTIMDIGPQTVHTWAPLIKRARTIVWNGPVGYFEEPEFSHGTLAVGRLVASRSKGEAFGVVGGGETVVALHRTGMAEYVDHISTAGGAMLEYLAGKRLPGLEALKRGRSA